MRPRTRNLEGIDIDGLLDSIEAPLAVVDESMRLVAVNAAYCVAGGKSRDELIGVVLFDAFPDNPLEPGSGGPGALRRSLDHVFAAGVGEQMPLQRYDVEHSTSGVFEHRYWSITTSPVKAPLGSPARYALIHAEEVTTFIDDRLRRETTGASTQTTGEINAIDTVFTDALTRLNGLNQLSEALVAANTIGEVARAVIRDGLAMVDAAAGVFLECHGDRLSLVEHLGAQAIDLAIWGRLTMQAGRDPFSDAISGGQPLFFDTAADLLTHYPDLDIASTAARHEGHVIIPLIINDHPIGIIALMFTEPGPFAVPIRLALHTLGNLATQSAARATLLSEQASVIESVHEIFNTRITPVDGIRTSGIYQPSTQLVDAGGDWYDVLQLDHDRIMIALGDVAGHGTHVAGEMARSRATVHAYALAGHDPAEIAQLSSIALARFSTTFTTGCIAIYEPSQRQLTWTTAGHPPPLLIDAHEHAEFLHGTHGPPLGVLTAPDTYTSAQRELQPGDTLVVYSDGLIEQNDEPIDVGLDRLLLHATGATDRTDLAGHLYRTMLPSASHNDDVSILAVTFD